MKEQEEGLNKKTQEESNQAKSVSQVQVLSEKTPLKEEIKPTSEWKSYSEPFSKTLYVARCATLLLQLHSLLIGWVWFIGLQFVVAQHYKLESTELSPEAGYYSALMANAFNIGFTIQAFCITDITQKYGSIRVIRVTSILQIFIYMGIGLSPNFYCLLTVTFIQGLSQALIILQKTTNQFWVDTEERRDTLIVICENWSLLATVTGISYGVLIYELCGQSIFNLGMALATQQAITTLAYNVLFHSVDQVEQRVMKENHENHQKEEENRQIQNQELKEEEQGQIIVDNIVPDYKKQLDFNAVFTTPKFSFAVIAFATIYEAKIIQTKLISLWISLPEKNEGLGLSRQQLAIVFFSAGIIAVPLSLLITLILQSKMSVNRPFSLYGALGVFICSITYLIAVYFKSQAYALIFVCFKETLQIFFLQIFGTGCLLECLGCIPQQHQNQVLSMGFFVLSVLGILGVFVCQFYFSWIMSQTAIIKTLGSFTVAIGFLPIILVFLYVLIQVIRHFKYKESQEEKLI